MSHLYPNHVVRRFFISCVTAEFGFYRDHLRREFTGVIEEAKVQEDFLMGPRTLLEKLDDYISQSSAVIHLVGKSAGSRPQPAEVRAILDRWKDFTNVLPELAEFLDPDACPFTYTQWECYLAIYHRIPCFIYIAEEGSLREERWTEVPAETTAQGQHLGRLVALGQDRMSHRFQNADSIALSVRKAFDNYASGATFAQATFEANRVQWPKELPARRDRLADRKEEFRLFRELLSDSAKTRILLLYGPSDLGKTTLLAALDAYASAIPALSCGRIEFKNGPSLCEALYDLSCDLAGIRFTRFERARSRGDDSLRTAFLDDLSETRRPVVLLLDTYEAATDETRHWVEQSLFGLARRFDGIRIVVCGKVVPLVEPPPRWSDIAHWRELPPVSDHSDWCHWLREVLGVTTIPDDHVCTMVRAVRGSPRALSSMFCELQKDRP